MITRDYLVKQAVNSVDEDDLMLAQALLVMHDAGLLHSPGTDEDGAPLFALHEGVTDEQLDAAQTAFLALNECDDDAWVSYLSREAH